jgi:hypothetical protein
VKPEKSISESGELKTCFVNKAELSQGAHSVETKVILDA